MQVLNDVTKLDSCCTTYVARSYFLTSDYIVLVLFLFFFIVQNKETLHYIGVGYQS